MPVEAQRRDSAVPSSPAAPDELERVLGSRRAADAAPADAAPADALTLATSRADLLACFASESAFRRFYEAALPRVYGYLFRRCPDRAVAEDLTQQTFLEAVRHRRSFDGRSSPLTWLTGIARHKLVDHFRALEREERRRMRLIVREIDVDPDATAWRTVDARDELVDALARLTSMQRAVLVLHYADGLPVDEVARLVGRSVGATESLLGRARESLRSVLREEAGR